MTIKDEISKRFGVNLPAPAREATQEEQPRQAQPQLTEEQYGTVLNDLVGVIKGHMEKGKDPYSIPQVKAAMDAFAGMSPQAKKDLEKALNAAKVTEKPKEKPASSETKRKEPSRPLYGAGEEGDTLLGGAVKGTAKYFKERAAEAEQSEKEYREQVKREIEEARKLGMTLQQYRELKGE
jgi:hypothetical protein